MAELIAKPCRILKSLGRCTRETPCDFPLGLTGCFSRYDEEVKAGNVIGPPLVTLLDMTIELSQGRGEKDKRVLVFMRWH